MARKVRVLFAIGSMAGGGSERQTANILRGLDRTRFSPSLYLIEAAGEFLSESPEDVPVFSFWKDRAAPRVYVPGRIHRMQAAHLAETLRRVEADVLYDRTYCMTLIAAAAARRRPVPRVAVIVSPPKWELAHAEERFLAVKRRLLRRAYHAAHRVAAVSEAVRSAAISEYGLPPERIVAVGNFVDWRRIDRLAEETPPDFPAERFHIVSAGRLHAAKGFGYLLEAMEELVLRRRRSRPLVHIFGQGPLEGELKAQVRCKGLHEHVRFAGFVPNPFPAFRAAQLFCLPSIYDGMPNVLLEAMVCGLPILASDGAGGAREILDDGRYGRLTPAADPIALADAIDDAIARPSAWRRTAAAARARVIEKFSASVGLARVEPLLEAAASGQRGALGAADP